LWHERWQDKAQNKHAAVWQDLAAKYRLLLYDGLDKAAATALFLLRTEVIGLNAWLASIGVPETHPRCPCGHPSQTVKHIVTYCPQQDRSRLLPELQTLQFPDLLCCPKSAKAVARWFIRQRILPQFSTAHDITMEDHTRDQALPDLDNWARE
jgi:hypothetical protein